MIQFIPQPECDLLTAALKKAGVEYPTDFGYYNVYVAENAMPISQNCATTTAILLRKIVTDGMAELIAPAYSIEEAEEVLTLLHWHLWFVNNVDGCQWEYRACSNVNPDTYGLRKCPADIRLAALCELIRKVIKERTRDTRRKTN